jgi:hypothetical protein
MAATSSQDVSKANQQALLTALERVRIALLRHIARAQGYCEATELDDRAATASIAAATHVLPALEHVCITFHLSPFERDLLLLCAGVELDSNFAALCADAQGSSQRAYPTFSLALAALPGAHWSALTPTGSLRHWRLIEVGAGPILTLRSLRIDERILHYLAGAPHADERLAGLLMPVSSGHALSPSHRALAEQTAACWSRATPGEPLHVVQLCGGESADKHAIAAEACALLGLSLSVLAADALPAAPGDLESLARVLEREAALNGSVLLLDCDELDAADRVRAATARRQIERLSGALFVATQERLPMLQRLTTIVDLPSLDAAEQRAMWLDALGPLAHGLNGQIARLAGQFNLNAHAIHQASSMALGRTNGNSAVALADALWDASRAQARPRLDGLAQRIEPATTWDDLVLPQAQRQILREIAVHVRQRGKVYTTWDFLSKGARGLGISALFAGASGVGKTMAAEALASELQLDLYRIDLSAVVSKYIGETERNLRQIFDAAEAGGAILLFDEADALFGKRSEVRDSHDRFANIEVSYLLQRMEAYRGLAILTTNMKQALDTAFLRRIRFVVQFPFPDMAQRAEIWRRIFPRATPTEGLDLEKLARLNVAGGNIRNIALSAAFLAADAGEAVRMPHLLSAARSEYAKLEKTLTEAEIEGWV